MPMTIGQWDHKGERGWVVRDGDGRVLNEKGQPTFKPTVYATRDGAAISALSFTLHDALGKPYDTSVTEYDVHQTMKRHGGSFVQALAEAFIAADPRNHARLRLAFPEIWDDYRQKAEVIKGGTK